MPLLQYRCKNCNYDFEELVKKFDQPVPCPKCGEVACRSYQGAVYSATGTQTKKCTGNCKTCGGCK